MRRRGGGGSEGGSTSGTETVQELNRIVPSETGVPFLALRHKRLDQRGGRRGKISARVSARWRQRRQTETRVNQSGAIDKDAARVGGHEFKHICAVHYVQNEWIRRKSD
jgi:hypothetical protein